MPRSEIHPVPTQRAGDRPVPAELVPLPVHEQIAALQETVAAERETSATLAQAVETTLATPAGNPAREDALTRVRDVLTRLGIEPSVPVVEGGTDAGSALTSATDKKGAT